MSEQKIENCPFCGSGCYERKLSRQVVCRACDYQTGGSISLSAAIDAHNRVTLAVQMLDLFCKSDTKSRELFDKAKREVDAMRGGEDD